MKNLREATVQEILDGNRLVRDFGYKIGFRHFTAEQLCSRAKYGVRHVDHSRAKVHQIDGKLFVRHHGKLQEITANIFELDGGKQLVMDVRIKSEYLPCILR